MPSRPPRARRPSPQRARPPAPVLFPRSQVPCSVCGLCCTYVTAEIPAPTTVQRASRILWYLYHEQVSVWWDHGDTWLVQFATRCRFFGDDRRCEIYAGRPHVCRELDERTCEVNARDEGVHFHEAAQFMDWLAQRRPRMHARLRAAGVAPEEAVLRGTPPKRAPLAPFGERYRALREQGAEKVRD
jgi:Fe-S-cluster containining protein